MTLPENCACGHAPHSYPCLGQIWTAQKRYEPCPCGKADPTRGGADGPTNPA